MSYQFTAIRMAAIENPKTANVGKDVRKSEPHALLVGI
jgi:hypothetical protein